MQAWGSKFSPSLVDQILQGENIKSEFCVEKKHKNLLFSRHVPNTHGANFFPKWAVPKFHIYLDNLIFFPKFHNQNRVLLHF